MVKTLKIGDEAYMFSREEFGIGFVPLKCVVRYVEVVPPNVRGFGVTATSAYGDVISTIVGESELFASKDEMLENIKEQVSQL